MTELRECPFCLPEKSHAEPWVEWEDMGDGLEPNRLYHVRGHCGCCGPVAESEQEAIEAWNRRHTPPEIAELIKRVEHVTADDCVMVPGVKILYLKEALAKFQESDDG
jgi:hypothetical protein